MVEVIVSADNIESLDWSPWLDFDRAKIACIPDSSVGVYKMHESMKILYIGSSQNLRQSLLDCLSDPCIGKTKRFSYAITQDADKVKDQLLDEYRSKHNDRLPLCMEGEH